MARLPIPFGSRLSAIGTAACDLQGICYAELAHGSITGSSSSSRSLPASASAHLAESRLYATLTTRSIDNVHALDLCRDFPGRCISTSAHASSASDASSSTTAQASTLTSCHLHSFHDNRSFSTNCSLTNRSCRVHRPSPPSPTLSRPFSASPIPESLLASHHQRSGPFSGNCPSIAGAPPNPRPRSCSLPTSPCCPCSPTPSCSNSTLASQPPWISYTRRQHPMTQSAIAATLSSTPSVLILTPPVLILSSPPVLILTATSTAVRTQAADSVTSATSASTTTIAPTTTWRPSSPQAVGPGAASQAPLIPCWWTVVAQPGAVRCLHNGRSGPVPAAADTAAAAVRGGGSGGGGPRGAGGLPREAPGWAAGGFPRRLGGGGGGGGATLPPRDEGLGAPMEVFDRPLKSLHRDRSAALLDGSDPLLAAVTDRLLDRLEDCRRGFETAVVLGGAALSVLQQLAGGRAGIQRLIVVDSSKAMLDRIRREAAVAQSTSGSKPWPQLLCVRGDEEALPLRPGSVDLIVSCLGLHWVNDLPGAMAQCRAALKPDGLFLSALLGGETLQELRIACALAQMEREGGISAVVSPLAQVRDAGNLLTRADLRLPSVDVDRFTLCYPSPLELVHHLRSLGESNAAHQRRRRLSRDSALAAAAVYQSMFGSEAPADGSGEDGSGGEGGGGGGAVSGVTATYEVIFMTGWAPSPHQPKAAKRGSATVSFQDLADGLVSSGGGVGGTAEGQLLTEGPAGAADSTANPRSSSAPQQQ